MPEYYEGIGLGFTLPRSPSQETRNPFGPAAPPEIPTPAPAATGYKPPWIEVNGARRYPGSAEYDRYVGLATGSVPPGFTLTGATTTTAPTTGTTGVPSNLAQITIE